jgi:uncharacterized protein
VTPRALGVPLVDEGGGRLSVDGARYLLIRPETLAGLQKALEAALPEGAADILAAGGRAGGGKAAAALDGAARARARRLLHAGGAIGWGEFTLERLTASELVVSVRGSPFAEAYGRAERPVCHLTRGVLDALAAAVLPHPVLMVETACAATGAPACRFAGSA